VHPSFFTKFCPFHTITCWKTGRCLTHQWSDVTSRSMAPIWAKKEQRFCWTALLALSMLKAGKDCGEVKNVWSMMTTIVSIKHQNQYTVKYESSRLDIRVQANGDRLAGHHDVSHGITAGAGDHQGLAGSRRGRLFQVISMQSLLFLISTVMGMEKSFKLL